MKTLQFLLICVLIGYCFTYNVAIEYDTKFESLLKEKYEVIGSCIYEYVEQKCIKTRNC